jgi:hypothetical protein
MIALRCGNNKTSRFALTPSLKRSPGFRARIAAAYRLVDSVHFPAQNQQAISLFHATVREGGAP